jgi:hypothetical protein
VHIGDLSPLPQQASAVSLEREAGYVLLGSLCLSLPTEVLVERQLQLLELFTPALGAEAGSQLEAQFNSNVVSAACWAGASTVSCGCIKWALRSSGVLGS